MLIAECGIQVKTSGRMEHRAKLADRLDGFAARATPVKQAKLKDVK